MPEFTAKELKSKTIEELAVLGERHHPLSAEGILIDNELKIRRNGSSATSSPKMKGWSKALAVLLAGVVSSLIAAALWYYFGLK